MQPMATGWTISCSPGIHVVLDEDVQDLPGALARINASAPRVRASGDGTNIRIEGAKPVEWSGVPVYYGPRPRFEGQLAQAETGERAVDGWIIRSDASQAFAVFGCLIAGFTFVAGLLVAADGDTTGFVSIVASFVLAGAVLGTWRLHRRLSDVDAKTIVDSLESLGRVTSS